MTRLGFWGDKGKLLSSPEVPRLSINIQNFQLKILKLSRIIAEKLLVVAKLRLAHLKENLEI